MEWRRSRNGRRSAGDGAAIETSVWITSFSVDILSMPDFDDFYQNDLIMDFIDDSVISNANPIR
jgi:hypothetical protein